MAEHPVVKILDVRVDKVTKEQALQAFEKMLEGSRCQLIVTPNAEIVEKASKTPKLKRIVNEEVHHDERQFGKSGYSFGKLVKTFFTNMMTNSDLPLKAISFVGILNFVASIALIIYLVIRYFVSGVSIAGWTSSVVLILFFGGVILFSIGIIGRYLTNIMQEAKKMPAYLIRRTDGGEDGGSDNEEKDAIRR